MLGEVAENAAPVGAVVVGEGVEPRYRVFLVEVEVGVKTQVRHARCHITYETIYLSLIGGMTGVVYVSIRQHTSAYVSTRVMPAVTSPMKVTVER